ncbi:L-threonylcarbamoyladenylate synthase [Alkalicoccus daliensis]|nr:L-threonylcarbamoyladenylate synthase [Alkalicoccus daliensis]
MSYQQTKYWSVDNIVDNLIESKEIQEAAAFLREGKLVAFPTETVYGLGASARSDEAVTSIFTAKGRPADNPLIVHISQQKDVYNFTKSVPEKAEKLMEKFWPGALTIILAHNGRLSTKVTAGLSTVGLRMPDHPVALALIEASGEPIAAPSANRSGRPSPTTAAHTAEDLQGRIAGIVDGGATGLGVESTVIDCSGELPIILRPGGVTQSQLEAVIGRVEVDQSLTEEAAPRSPGMKYKHYAPEAPLTLVDGDEDFFRSCVRKHKENGEKVGLILFPALASMEADAVYILSDNRIETTARELYSALRTFKKSEVDHILMQAVPADELGFAVMNRLVKAAGGRILTQ